MVEASIIIPAYNEEKYIERCLHSILNQSFKDFEVIMVDDGSTDATKHIVRKYPVLLLEQSHKGPGLARNLGAKNAKGKILVFVDADMEFDRNFLERLVAPIQKGDAMGTFHKEEYVANRTNTWASCWSLNSGLPIDRRIKKDHPDESTIFRAILKDEFLKIGGYEDTGYGDDETLYQKLGMKAKAAPDAVCYHNNPSTLKEVYQSAKWFGKGKNRVLEEYVRDFIKYSLPISIVKGILKSIVSKRLYFVIFKVTYDFGVMHGMLSSVVTGRHTK